jgi:hypothetical protein
MAPFIGTWILQKGYGRGMLALYLIAMAVVTIAAVVAASETANHDVERL